MAKPKKSKTIDDIIIKFNNFVAVNFENMSDDFFSYMSNIDPRFVKPEKVKKTSLTSSELLLELATIKDKISKKSSKSEKSIYHIPDDVVEFMVNHSSILFYGKNSTAETDLEDLCLHKTFLDPVCKSGDFLVYVTKRKMEMLSTNPELCTDVNILNVFSTIYGIDADVENILITRMRQVLLMLPCIYETQVKDLIDILVTNYLICDFVNHPSNPFSGKQFDFIIGNPPFIENKKYTPGNRIDYGNVYANVLDNSISRLTDRSCMSFIIPISYVSTLRMKDIRSKMHTSFHEQYIFSYADRPSSLIPSNHQKLCICMAKRDTSKEDNHIITSNYTIWHKPVRENLFHNYMVTENTHMCKDYIPKLGNAMDISIYEKIAYERYPLYELINGGSSAKISINNAATFWVKAFKVDHTGYGYKQYECKSDDLSYLALCLLNSSLFWWFWSCVSDCRHLTTKDFKHFGIPNNYNPAATKILALNLERKLEQTKQFIGSKQIDYEYKHRLCEKELDALDEYVNSLYGLTREESDYIKNFKKFYRFSESNSDSEESENLGEPHTC